MFTIRNPVPAESGIVSDLIIESDCGLLPALFGAEVKALLSHLQTAVANPYSAENTLVAVQAADPGPTAVVGALVGSLAGAGRNTHLHTALLLFRWYGLEAFARFARLARAGKALDDLEVHDLYISHIAVLDRLRGGGVGSRLLLAAPEEPRNAGARRLVLDVDEQNEGARAFYAHMDFQQSSVVRIDLGARGQFRFLRLVRDL
jgi:ribosomal protein S18 acetylase RimI-like enzyme